MIIDNKKELKKVLAIEKNYYVKRNVLILHFFNDDSYYFYKFLRFLRKEEYFRAKNKKIFLLYYSLKRKYGRKVHIDASAFALGLCPIFLHGNIIIGSGSKVGNYCTFCGSNTLGQTKNLYPSLGNNIYLGHGACIYGDIKIGNNSIIGAGAVVLNNVKDGTIVAGVPAKVIKEEI